MTKNEIAAECSRDSLSTSIKQNHPNLFYLFLDRPFRANDQQTPGVDASSQLGPDKSRLNCFAESYFVRNQDSARWGLQKGQHGLILVGVKIGIRCVHAVDEVGEST